MNSSAVATDSSVATLHAQDPVETFLNSLRRPCGRYTKMFKDYGVETAADLDALCKMEDYWSEVQQYFTEKGLSAFDWLVVRDGLIVRGTKIPG